MLFTSSLLKSQSPQSTSKTGSKQSPYSELGGVLQTWRKRSQKWLTDRKLEQETPQCKLHFIWLQTWPDELLKGEIKYKFLQGCRLIAIVNKDDCNLLYNTLWIFKYDFIRARSVKTNPHPLKECKETSWRRNQLATIVKKNQSYLLDPNLQVCNSWMYVISQLWMPRPLHW